MKKINTKILGICGSPRSGNTEWIMNEVFKEIPKDIGELILLRNMQIKFCDGDLFCEDVKRCRIHDDMVGLYEKLVNCEKIVIGTPVYFDSIPALLKNFIDRLNPLCVTEKLKRKELYLIIVGQLKGAEGEKSKKRVEEYFKILCEIFGMVFRRAWKFSARQPNDISKFPHIRKICQNIRSEIFG